MQTPTNPAAPRMSTVILHLLSALLGLAGTALVIAQALFWIPRGHVHMGVLVFTACVPLIAAGVFAIVPRRAPEDDARNYPLRAPMVWVNLALPVLLTVLTMIVIGASGSFDNFFGLALLLAANAGRNLRDWARTLLLRIGDVRSR